MPSLNFDDFRPSLRGWRRAGCFAAVGLLLLGGCDDERGGSLGRGVLIVAPRRQNALGEEIVGELSDYLETVSGSVPNVHRLQGEGDVSIESIASVNGAGLVIVLDASRIEHEGFDFTRMAALGEDGFALDVED